jgi:hypothetical protein
VPDIFPYGPARFVTWQQVFDRLRHIGMTAGDAAIGAAIGSAESGLDLAVINDTPATGDYSVGYAQINYYGSLYAGRVAEFGTPRFLVTNGLNAQAYAMLKIRQGQGWSAWSTFSSGAYRQFLHGYSPGAGAAGVAAGGHRHRH